MKKTRSRIGQGMFEWIDTSRGRVDPRTGRVVGAEYQAPIERQPAQPERQYPPSQYPASRWSGGEMIVSPQSREMPASRYAPPPGMFDWIGTSTGQIDPRTGRPVGQFAPKKKADEDEYSQSEIESIPSIDGWRRRASMGAAGSSSAWLVGLSVLVGFGIAAAVAFTHGAGQQPKT